MISKVGLQKVGRFYERDTGFGAAIEGENHHEDHKA
jgi:hypothetical protein